jgi:hypothetical protein
VSDVARASISLGMAEPLDRELELRITSPLERPPISLHRVSGGYTPAERWLVCCRSDERAFV